MNMILIEPGELDGSGRVELVGRRAVHLVSVLGATPGRVIRVGILDGPTGEGTVISASPGKAVIECRMQAAVAPESGISLLLALPRPKVLKRLWAPLASLGVDRILLTNAARVERNYFDTHWIDRENFGPLLREGLEQACRTRLPGVSVHRRLKPLVEDELAGLCPDAVRLIADPSGPLLTAAAAGVQTARTLLAIGPEGGWTDFERKFLMKNGFAPVSLGCHPLRSDVACIALIAVLTAARHLDWTEG